MTRAGVAYYEREQRDLVRINYVEPQRARAVVDRPETADGARARGVLRRADRRVGARGACRRAAVPAGRRRSSRRLASGVAGRAAGAVLRVLAAAAAGRVSGVWCASVRRDAESMSDGSGPVERRVMPPREDHVPVPALCARGGRHAGVDQRDAIPESGRAQRRPTRWAPCRWTPRRRGSSRRCIGR